MPDLTARPRYFPALLLIGISLMLFGLALLPTPTVNAQQEPTPFPLYALPDARLTTAVSSSTLALGRDNRTLVTANMLSNTLSVFSISQGELLAELPIGIDPRSVALTEDGTRAVTANRGDGTLSVVTISDLANPITQTIDLGGGQPYGVVLGEGDRAYVSLQGSAQVVVVDLLSGQVLNRIAVPPQPSGLALWGDFLYVTHFWSGQISLIYLPLSRVATTVSSGLDTSISQAIEIDVTRGIAYLPQTRSNAQNTFLTFDTTVFPVVNVLDLRGLSVRRPDRVTLDTADRSVNMPFAVALDRFRQWLFVANAGSNDVSVIDLNTGLARANIQVGANPRGILLNRDNSLLFVHNVLDGTLTIIETRNLTVDDEVAISDVNIPVDALIGAQLFYSAADARLSANRWLSCANCHFDGASDGRVWQGLPEGPRNTPLLYNLLGTAPYNWSASWDELADVELKIRLLQGGSGLIEGQAASPALGDPHAGRSLDLDVLASYLGTLTGPANPNPTGTEAVARGEQIFTEQECATCHAGTTGSDLLRHDVGTGGEFDTPALRWLWLSAPYFHDGRAAALHDVFALPGAHQLIATLSAEDIDALVAYLLTLPA
ncbi:MAG: beta-propeller fold lactonase family protein [Anaerolineae bacterium]|nr:beta-propeller fold lactonase family protein [Anaerolineae bacterium]